MLFGRVFCSSANLVPTCGPSYGSILPIQGMLPPESRKTGKTPVCCDQFRPFFRRQRCQVGVRNVVALRLNLPAKPRKQPPMAFPGFHLDVVFPFQE